MFASLFFSAESYDYLSSHTYVVGIDDFALLGEYEGRGNIVDIIDNDLAVLSGALGRGSLVGHFEDKVEGLVV